MGLENSKNVVCMVVSHDPSYSVYIQHEMTLYVVLQHSFNELTYYFGVDRYFLIQKSEFFDFFLKKNAKNDAKNLTKTMGFFRKYRFSSCL